MAAYSKIGPYEVITMSPRPPKTAEQVVLESQAGKDGHAAWKTGTRGKQFTVKTVVDEFDFPSAQALCDSYEALISNVVPIRYADRVMPFTVLVLDVTAVPTRTVLGIGGRQGTSRAMVEATWKLVTWS